MFQQVFQERGHGQSLNLGAGNCTGALPSEVPMKRVAIVVGALVALAVTPASAQRPSPCTGENMAKVYGAWSAMPDSPRRFTLAGELAGINSEMSKGNMRGACGHFYNAQMVMGAQ